jgi:sugar O-acyltransferase (sialic acid O-acetyltransferase NeuD family)
MKNVIILGAGGFASEIIDTIEELNKTNEEINVMGFVYENASPGVGPYGFPILGDFDYLEKLDLSEIFFICAVGTPELKKQLVDRVKLMRGKFLTIIHPRAYVSKGTKIGEGCIIQSHCILVGVDVVLGDFVIFNDNVAIGHAAKIGNYTHINPNVNISGEAELGAMVFVGVKATILKAKIGDGAVIGACALITKDVPPNVMAKGIPAVYSEKTEKRYK